MMEGIEVLSKTEILDTPGIAVSLFAFSFFAIIITLSLTILFFYEKNKKNSIIFVSLSWLLFIVLLISLYMTDKPTGEYTYKVTIHDSVSMNEFNERYEIIEVEGKIYTIKEKE